MFSSYSSNYAIKYRSFLQIPPFITDLSNFLSYDHRQKRTRISSARGYLSKFPLIMIYYVILLQCKITVANGKVGLPTLIKNI